MTFLPQKGDNFKTEESTEKRSFFNKENFYSKCWKSQKSEPSLKSHLKRGSISKTVMEKKEGSPYTVV